MKFKSEFELLEFAQGLIGKQFKELDAFNLLNNEKANKGKGILGQLVETGYFGYSNNNKPEADFKELGIELKVSGFLTKKDGSISAKERLVLSKIDFNQIIKESFEFSKFIFKNKKILLVWYEYDSKKNYSEMIIKKIQIYDMTKDLNYIEQDFNIIKAKVIKGEAHLISEGDTSLLGACTKAADSSVRTKQPNSNIPAKPRAYSLKQSYLTGVLNDTKLSFTSRKIDVNNFFRSKIEKYIGLTQLEILESLGVKIEKIPKNISKMILDRIIGSEKEISKIEPFNKINFLIKSSPVNNENKLLERLSFHNISLDDFNEKWEDSYWKNFFEEQTIFLFLFEGSNKIKNGQRKLIGFKTITFNEKEIESFGKTYDLIKESIIAKDANILPTPKSFSNQFLVIAPKGVKGDKAYANFFKSNKTKACLMIEKDLINKKLEKI